MFDILYIATGAIITACATYFIDVCMRDGMIFEKYYKFLVDYHAEKHEEYENYKFNDNDLEELAVHSFWFKPLGGCSTCMNVWLCFITFPFTLMYFDIPVSFWTVLLFFSYVFISNAVLRKYLTD